MEVNGKLLALLISLAVVCVISILGSFANWLGDQFDGHTTGDPSRWKWMCVSTLFLLVINLLIWGS